MVFQIVFAKFIGQDQCELQMFVVLGVLRDFIVKLQPERQVVSLTSVIYVRSRSVQNVNKIHVGKIKKSPEKSELFAPPYPAFLF